MPSLAAVLAVSLFGWYDSPIANPLNHAEFIAQQGAYSNITASVRYWVKGDWDAAKAAGLKVVIGLPHELQMTIDDARPLILEQPMWCRMPSDWIMYEHPDDSDPDGWCNKTAVDWVNLVRAHRAEIAAVSACDECDCNYGVHGPGAWTPSTCDLMARKIEAILAAIRLYLPGVPTWIGYSATWAGFFIDPNHPQRAPRSPTWYGVRLASADWLSFNCYTLFEKCYAGATVRNLADGWQAKMSLLQRLVLVPRAFGGPYLGWNPQPVIVSNVLWQYLGYMRSEPRVVAMLPFIPFSNFGDWGTGGLYIPEIRTAVEQIGRLLTKPAAAPSGLRILRES